VKTLTGRTPVDIIRLSRLNRSKVLLETTDKNVSEVAYEVGFTAPSYFTKCFKDEFGISPSDL
jgi:transcriptional regulator GlxA family with amidase domain